MKLTLLFTKTMGTNAPGQLLGFSLQYPRALFHLLKCSPGEQVSLEVFGDVGLKKEDNSKISEEDKSSQNSNPVTDRATDLWKTFYNWTSQVKKGEFDISTTIYMLYTNKSGRKGIVDSFHSSRNKTTADAAIRAAFKKLKDVEDKHEIFPYLEFLKANQATFSQIIEKFEFVVGSETGIKEVEKAIRSKHVSETQIEYLKHSLLGWLQHIVMEKLAAKTDALITWEEFDTYAQKVFTSARARELIDFALVYPPDEEEHQQQKLGRPYYIQQLEKIGCDDLAIQEAVIAYLRSKINRQNWIAVELIDENDAISLETNLTQFWDNRRREIDIIHSGLEDEQKGQLVYLACKGKQQSIRNQEPPVYTIAGSYHLLSDSLSLGWHPKWKDSFLADIAKGDE